MTSIRRFGFSLPELMLTMALFAMAAGLLFGILNDGFRKWRLIYAKNETQQRLTKALTWLQKDLEKANPNQIGMKRISAAGNGDVIWFLSAEDPTITSPDLRFIRDPASGAPKWQRHIVYYLIRPSNYAKVSGGYTCAVDPDPRNDYYAPHKVLIRKVVNRPEQPETLMTAAQIDIFVTAPADLNVSPLASESQVDECKLVSDGLLSLEATRYDRTIELNLRAVYIQRADREVKMGSTSLKDGRYTQNSRLRVWMKQ